VPSQVLRNPAIIAVADQATNVSKRVPRCEQVLNSTEGEYFWSGCPLSAKSGHRVCPTNLIDGHSTFVRRPLTERKWFPRSACHKKKARVFLKLASANVWSQVISGLFVPDHR
jgi:hypothetical protein